MNFKFLHALNNSLQTKSKNKDFNFVIQKQLKLSSHLTYKNVFKPQTLVLLDALISQR